MVKITQERADEILEQLDQINADLQAADMLVHANTVMGLIDELEDDFERAANAENPFLIRTVKEFVAAVNELEEISDAYSVFETRCTEELKHRIYLLGDTSPEPFRASMWALGYQNY